MAKNPAWISEGEKYALLAMSVKLDDAVKPGQIGPALWILANQRFDLDSFWRDWLGTVWAEHLDDCNLLLVSKVQSQRPDVLDAENQALQRRVSEFYVGLLL
jgi:hypothetical protein